MDRAWNCASSSSYQPGAGELVEAAGTGEYDEADIGIAEDAELSSLLHQPAAPLREGHLPVGPVVDPLDRDLPSSHIFFLSSAGLSLSLFWFLSLSLYLSGRGRRRADEICEKREQTWNKIGLPGGANDAVERRKAV
jgi:hypothetical protein